MGPAIDVEPFLQYDYNLQLNPHDWSWDLLAGMESTLIFRLGFLDWQLADYPIELLDPPYEIFHISDEYTPVGDCCDIDDNCYATVEIGDQLWMAENLKVTHYNNGEEIPNITNNGSWGSLSTGAYGDYNNDPDNAEIYGRLYNWYAVDDARGICPEGFHVPTDEEWIELEMELGMSWEEAHDTGWRGTDQGSQLAGNADLWYSGQLVDNPAFGSSDFTALPGGYRHGNNGSYNLMGSLGYFWSSSEGGSNTAWLRLLGYSPSGVYRDDSSRRHGFSVRCVGD